MYKIVYTSLAQKDAKKLASSNLKRSVVKRHVKLCIAKLKSSNKILKSNLLLDE